MTFAVVDLLKMLGGLAGVGALLAIFFRAFKYGSLKKEVKEMRGGLITLEKTIKKQWELNEIHNKKAEHILVNDHGVDDISRMLSETPSEYKATISAETEESRGGKG